MVSPTTRATVNAPMESFPLEDSVPLAVPFTVRLVLALATPVTKRSLVCATVVTLLSRRVIVPATTMCVAMEFVRLSRAACALPAASLKARVRVVVSPPCEPPIA